MKDCLTDMTHLIIVNEGGILKACFILNDSDQKNVVRAHFLPVSFSTERWDYYKIIFYNSTIMYLYKIISDNDVDLMI